MPFNTEKPELKCYKGYILQPYLSIMQEVLSMLQTLTYQQLYVIDLILMYGYLVPENNVI